MALHLSLTTKQPRLGVGAGRTRAARDTRDAAKRGGCGMVIVGSES
jgi:hypothetical protein